MNSYIEAQITNMINFTKTFQASCEMAALKDDGTIDKEEAKQLKKINTASEKFIRALEAIAIK